MTAANGKGSLAEALLAFQAEAPAIQKDKLNPAFRSKYVGLETVMEAALPLLNKHGIVLTQMPTTIVSGDERVPALLTRLMHAPSGEVLQETMPLILDKQNPQGLGSALTYAKRQAIMAFLGLVADEDDDGNKASRTPSPQRPAAVATTQAAAGTPAPDAKKSRAKLGKLIVDYAQAAGKPLKEVEAAIVSDSGDVAIESLDDAQVDALIGKLERGVKNLKARAA